MDNKYKNALEVIKFHLRDIKLNCMEGIEELVNKATPIKFYLEGDGYVDGEMVYDTLICPTCGATYEVDYEDEFKYCPNCGQARKVVE